MSEKKYSVVLTVILVIIIIAIIGLLGFVAFNFISTKNSTQQASDFVDSFTDTISTAETENTTKNNTVSPSNIITENTITDETDLNTDTNTTTVSGKKKVTYKGFETLGTIQIPKTNVKYPILAKMSKSSLETAPVAIYPMNVELNTVGNVVIVGHNYRNGTFFSNNKQLNIGDKIYITDLNGNRVTYVIYNKFETSQTDTKSYNKDTNGKREITLSTCTDASNDQRLIIEAREE